jgi:hypothetical protein
VGLANFQLFLGTVFKMLKKDGLFFMQARHPSGAAPTSFHPPFSIFSPLSCKVPLPTVPTSPLPALGHPSSLFFLPPPRRPHHPCPAPSLFPHP